MLLQNAQLVTHQEVFPADITVENGKITKIMRRDSIEQLGDPRQISPDVFDLAGKYLLPGLIDAHVHFRTPGMTQKEDWTTGSKAALAGGVTTVLDMPNTVPPTVDAQSLAEKRAVIEKEALVHFGLYAGATADNVHEITKLENIVGIKIYMGSSTGGLLVRDAAILEQLFRKAQTLIALHAEKEDCIQQGETNFLRPDGVTDPSMHSQIRAPECALQAVQQVFDLLDKIRGDQAVPHVHFCHVSTAGEVELLAQKKRAYADLGLYIPISAEVTPHHLFLTEDDYARYGNLVKVNPPLRSYGDQQALWKGLQDGVIDMVATDHAPHLLEEKNQPYEKAPSGVPGVQTMLPLLLQAVHEGKLTLPKVVELTSYNPARIFGFSTKGFIQEGADADLVVVDLEKREKICHHYLWSKCGWSPFHGWMLQGWPVMTFVSGQLRYEWRDRFVESNTKS